MDYEQKYKEALERAKDILSYKEVRQKDMEYLFPELKESEESSWKPSKEQFKALDYAFYRLPDTERGMYYGDILETLIEDLHRLEKQGKQKFTDNLTQQEAMDIAVAKCFNEQKPVDKVEPKFKVGDWVLYSGDHYEGVRHITKIDENGYYIERNGLPHGIIPFNHEICMRPWTIQDAKDGDVLVYRNSATEIIMLFKSWLLDKEVAYTHFHIFDNEYRVNSSCDCGNGVHPATKEQRGLLFQKMKEAGYEWDADEKELKKIEQKPAEWSEEDEKMLYDAIGAVGAADYYTYDDKVEIERWLKSLKQRIGE